MALKEYKPGTAFTGVIGRTFDVSEPAWPEPLRSKEGAPNVLFIVQDDTGFGQMGCYGSPIKTPNIDALAANGLRFNNMHTTALCSPTRCVRADRAQSPLERDVVHHGRLDRVPGRQRQHPVRERPAVGDSPAAGLQHLRPRQVALDAGGSDLRGGTVRSLAPGTRLRALLRLPRRGHPSVLPGADARQPLGRAGEDLRKRAIT